jgi:hypothetical protein
LSYFQNTDSSYEPSALPAVAVSSDFRLSLSFLYLRISVLNFSKSMSPKIVSTESVFSTSYLLRLSWKER